jgi:cytidylate kinase
MGGWHDLGRPAALILEGCGAGALRFAAAVSVLAWVEAPEDVRHARALQRDGEQVRPYLEQWWTLEAEHFRRNDTRARADLVIDTSSFAARSDT